MDIQQTLIKKKLVISIICLITTIFAGGMIYIISNYMTISDNNKSNNSQKQSELPNGSNVTVTVNNFLNEIPKPQKIESSEVVAPPEVVTSNHINKIDTLMENPPIQQPQIVNQPKMLIVGDVVANENQTTNSISNVNSNIGTGEINSKLANQKSPYTIFAGTFLPAILVTGLNSDLNGIIVATIRNDVYDSTLGKYLLIPQGSRLIGTYNHDVSYGQNRLMAGWNRIIYPNGTSINLHGQPGTDLQGFSGFSGEIDNHYSKVFGSSFIMGLIFGGMTTAIGNQPANSNQNQISAGATIATQVGTQMAQTGLQVVNRGLNIPPSIIISPGYRFNILMTSDLLLKPYIFKDNKNG